LAEEDEERAQGEAPPGVDELIEAIRTIEVGQFLLSTVSTLASLAYGKLDAGALDEAKTAIDAVRALLPVLGDQVEESLRRDFEAALANLQVAYADAVGRGQ